MTPDIRPLTTSSPIVMTNYALPNPTNANYPNTYYQHNNSTDPNVEINRPFQPDNFPLTLVHPLPHTLSQNYPMHHPPVGNSPLSLPCSPQHTPHPSAPRLSQVDPVAALLTRTRAGKGPPPEYATIDPRKLRLRHLRPIFTQKPHTDGTKSPSSRKDHNKLSGTGWRKKR